MKNIFVLKNEIFNDFALLDFYFSRLKFQISFS